MSAADRLHALNAVKQMVDAWPSGGYEAVVNGIAGTVMIRRPVSDTSTTKNTAPIVVTFTIATGSATAAENFTGADPGHWLITVPDTFAPDDRIEIDFRNGTFVAYATADPNDYYTWMHKPQIWKSGSWHKPVTVQRFTGGAWTQPPKTLSADPVNNRWIDWDMISDVYWQPMSGYTGAHDSGGSVVYDGSSWVYVNKADGTREMNDYTANMSIRFRPHGTGTRYPIYEVAITCAAPLDATTCGKITVEVTYWTARIAPTATLEFDRASFQPGIPFSQGQTHSIFNDGLLATTSAPEGTDKQKIKIVWQPAQGPAAAETQVFNAGVWTGLVSKNPLNLLRGTAIANRETASAAVFDNNWFSWRFPSKTKTLSTWPANFLGAIQQKNHPSNLTPGSPRWEPENHANNGQFANMQAVDTMQVKLKSGGSLTGGNLLDLTTWTP